MSRLSRVGAMYILILRLKAKNLIIKAGWGDDINIAPQLAFIVGSLPCTSKSKVPPLSRKFCHTATGAGCDVRFTMQDGINDAQKISNRTSAPICTRARAHTHFHTPIAAKLRRQTLSHALPPPSQSLPLMCRRPTCEPEYFRGPAPL